MESRYDGYKQINDARVQAVIQVPDRLPSRQRLLSLVLLAHLVGTLSMGVYLLLLWESAELSWASFPWLPLTGLSLLMLALAAAFAWRDTTALGRIEASLGAGAAVAELQLEDVRDALIHHRALSRSTFVLWLFGSAGFAVGAAASGAWTLDLLTHLGVMGLSVPVLMAVIVRYVAIGWHGMGVAGVLLPDGVLDHLGPMPMERVFRHVMIIYSVLGILMPLSLVIVARSAHASTPLLLHVVLDFGVCGLFVTFAVMRSVSLPVGYMESRMAEVGAGDLQVRARIFAADTFGSLSTHFNRMVEGLRQREQIRDIFGRYVTRQVAEEILSGRVELGGERRTATVLFADIRGFTTLSEELDPEEVVALLNEVLGTMVRCVLDEGGVLDKYIGDAIMALFGVPLSAGAPEADAQAAVRCALRMSQALDALNAERAALGRLPVELGIGVHTGELVAGNIGIPERMEYTVIGDTVNLCSRLEGLTKDLKQRILVSEATKALLPDTTFEEVDTVRVRGRSEPVTVFTPAA